MVLGARQLGTRGLGDNTATVPGFGGALVASGTLTFSDTVAITFGLPASTTLTFTTVSQGLQARLAATASLGFTDTGELGGNRPVIGTGTLSFTCVTEFTIDEAVCAPEPIPLDTQDGTVVRWQFYDPVTLETYVFHINPKDGGSPTLRRSITFEQTVASTGQTLVYEGSAEPSAIAWSGTILEQDHYEAYEEWYAKRRQVRVTDDLGRSFWIVIKSFAPQRRRSSAHPWRHDYQVEGVEVDWA